MKSSFNEAILRSLIMISNAWCLIFLTSSLPCCSLVAYLFVSVKWFPGGFGVFLCKLLLFLAYLSMGASVLTLAIMIIDRYFAIVRPMRRPLSVCPPRWFENIHDSHNITMFEMVIRFVLLYLVPLLTMAICFIPKLCCICGKGRRLDCTSIKIKSVSRSRKGGQNACHHSDTFDICWLLLKKLEAYRVIRQGADICICRSTHSANSAETRLVSKRYDRRPEFHWEYKIA